MQSLKNIVINRLVVLGLSSGLMVSALATVAVEPPSFEEWLSAQDSSYDYVDVETAVADAEAAVAYIQADMAAAQLDFSELDIDTLRSYADVGNAIAQYNLGVRYAFGKGIRQDHKKAFEWYQKSANQGVSQAQYNLGVMYDQGLSVRQDHKKASEWYQKSANQQNSKAQYNLGVAYSMGEGVRQNKATAKEWFGKSCDNGLQLGCDEYRKLNEKGN